MREGVAIGGNLGMADCPALPVSCGSGRGADGIAADQLYWNGGEGMWGSAHSGAQARFRHRYAWTERLGKRGTGGGGERGGGSVPDCIV